MTPFVVGGFTLAGFEVQADGGYHHDIAGRHLTEDIATGVAVGRSVTAWLTPFLELRFIDQLRGGDARVQDRLQVYVTRAANFRAGPATLVIGVEVPVSDARTFDYGLRASLFWPL